MMVKTRSAARIGFVILLLGAGVAAVGARPTAPDAGGRLEILPGDPRLDMAWALAQRGMSEVDASRVSVLLVDQLDTQGELVPMTLSWGAEFWWRSVDGAGMPATRMVRGRVALDWGNAMQKAIEASGCGGAAVAFIPVRGSSLAPLPIPPSSPVLVRLLGIWATGDAAPLDPSAFTGAGSAPAIVCQPVVVDLEYGVSMPTRWPQ